jgi:hypothetical protein
MSIAPMLLLLEYQLDENELILQAFAAGIA